MVSGRSRAEIKDQGWALNVEESKMETSDLLSDPKREELDEADPVVTLIWLCCLAIYLLSALNLI